MPTISVIVPVYKVEPYLHCCVDSILSQTFKDFELILVDDGSPDRCGEMCDEYAEKDSRVRVIHQENGGQAVARNHGVSVAKGEWICFVDSDDAVHPQTLELLLDGAVSHQANISVCHVTKDDVCPQWSDYRKTDWELYQSDKEETLLTFLKDVPHCYWLPCAKLVHIRLLKQYPFPTGKIYEDNAIVFRWLYNAKTVAVCQHKCYWYRDNPNSTTKSDFSVKRLDYLWALTEQICFYKDRHYDRLYRLFCREYFQMAISFYDSMKTIDVTASQMKAFRKTVADLYRRHKEATDLTDYELARLQNILHPHTYTLREKWRQLFRKRG